MQKSLSILVTGGAGEIGSRLVERLLQKGHRIRVLALPEDNLAGRLQTQGCEVARGDITRQESLTAAFQGVHTVYHLAAVLLVEDEALFQRVNVEGTRNVVQAAEQAGVSHLIHISSASVVYPQSTPYSRSKQRGEQLVRQSTLPWTIVRPTLVYDGVGGLEFKTFARFVTRWPIVPLLGDGRARKNPVHVDDLISGLAVICGQAQSYGKLYNLCGGEVLTIRELARLIQRQSGRQRPIIGLPLPLCRLPAVLLGRLSGRRMLLQHTLAGLTQDADLDCSEARRELGYAPVGICAQLAGGAGRHRKTNPRT